MVNLFSSNQNLFYFIVVKEIEYNEDEEFKFPSFEMLKKMENWSHLSPSILKVQYTFF